MPSHPLKVLVIGAGAIGSYVGGSLALKGHPVIFLDRPQAVAQIRAQGMSFRLPDGDHHLAPTLVESIPEALEHGPFDFALLAVKSYHTASAIAPFQPYAHQIPPLLCLQNGVDNEPLLETCFGAEKVIAGTVTTAIGRPAPNLTVVERLRGLGLAASPDAPYYPLATRIITALDDAGLCPQLFPNAPDMKWTKLLSNLVANATSAILDLSPAEIFAHPGLVRLEMAQLREAIAVMKALGASVISLPGTPMPALKFAVHSLPFPVARPLLARAIGRGRGGKMPSLHIDLHAGNPLSEVIYLNGAVAAHGAHAGIATPVNRVLNDTVLALAKGARAKEEFARQPEKLLQLL